MSSWPTKRGAVAGLALLLAAPVLADDTLRQTIRQQLRDESYVLVEGPYGARLFVLSADGSGYRTNELPEAMSGASTASARTRSADARERVRGLTELAGNSNGEALLLAFALLSDPDAAVREEAVQFVMEHPEADRGAVIAIALSDPSPRVREAATDVLEDETSDDEGDE